MPRDPDSAQVTMEPVARHAYRADIQMVRALAVIAVVLYHLKAPGMGAGFLGVDAFFVISGYLMQHIYRPEQGALSFYRRRARRLLPAYFATAFATLAIAFLVTLPVELAQVSEQVAYASVLVPNIGFWMQNSYFSRAEFHPLLHLWSLGVELQFYLLLPLLWLGGRRWKFFIPTVLGLSLAACLIVVSVSPKTAFFMMPLRIWEFAAGMAVAIYAPTMRDRPIIGFLAMLLLALGFMLPFSGDGLGPLLGHPGIAAIGVTALTSAILWFGLPDRMTAHWIGRTGQRIGDASYSIYLAHYPVIALWFYAPFSGTLLGDGRVATMLAPAALAILASGLLYSLVERNGGRLFTPARAALASIALLAMATIAPPIQTLRFDLADRAIFAAWDDRGPYRCGKLFRVFNPSAMTCDLSSGPNGQILLIGDSYADAIKQGVVSVAARRGYGVRFAVGNAPLRNAAQSIDWLRNEMERDDVRAAIFHYAPKNLTEDVVRQVATLGSVRPVAVLLSAPVYDRSVPHYLYESRRGPTAPLLRVDELRPASLHASGLTRFDLSDAFCAPPPCALTDEAQRPLYFDAGHLTLTALHRIEPIIEQAIVAIVR